MFNNAGIAQVKPFNDITEDDWHRVMDVNAMSVLIGIQEVSKQFIAQGGGGKIINIGSMMSIFGAPFATPYGATKAGLAQVTRTMAIEWAPDNIQVNMIAPGFIQTPLTDAGLFQNEQRRRWLEARTPLRRPGKPQDLLGAALLLASPASDYMTGTTVTVDGGFLIGGSWDKDGV
ncbi:MAG: SDR family oxidoreductase, partial [Caldilineaceae bacterium]|nr:SDR family oxidoreductase [Caldilineaceae bacterium]